MHPPVDTVLILCFSVTADSTRSLRKKSPIDTPHAASRLFSVPSEGSIRPFSIAATVVWVTPARRANSRWENDNDTRRACNRWPMSLDSETGPEGWIASGDGVTRVYLHLEVINST